MLALILGGLPILPDHCAMAAPTCDQQPSMVCCAGDHCRCALSPTPDQAAARPVRALPSAQPQPFRAVTSGTDLTPRALHPPFVAAPAFSVGQLPSSIPPFLRSHAFLI